MEPLKPSPQDPFLWQDRLFELNNSYKVMAEKQTTELLDKITK